MEGETRKLGRGQGEEAYGWDQTRGWQTDSGNRAASRWTDDPGAVWDRLVWCGERAEERVGVGESG